ncbi:putative metalloprotease CJM1_0395 family protein [Aliiglaciecola sp. LCG003]|uniref:putative metalloprotease CJM1_0395 family protein n=1 Tax=Aliiglaciecola sp. LCG003 TaxID=3053655 RepID=UPI0025743216|nr:putative metalloprotease CJM1_0395 family protein [Aliiglaciecola sp. LCG003]WJG09326.1 putative metalloprotease CJM1_0395 family protein [Aliiglaciecola sp. LCG003]
MNIVTPTPTAIVFTTGNVNTEAARRDNIQRETIPQANSAENSAAESGLGSESDRAKAPGQPPQLTYERPQIQQNANGQNGSSQGDLFNQDNAEDASAGKQDAEAKQQQQQQELAEQREVEELKSRDAEVRTHEQAHASAGGEYTGSPSYEFESGPDGRQYAVGGEVSIDVSKEKSPEETIRKMQQVRAAALAPAEPSPQDLRVASDATRFAAEARAELAKDKSESANQAVADDIQRQFRNGSEQEEQQPSTMIGDFPELDDIVDGINTQPDTRSLEIAAADPDFSAQDTAALQQQLDSRDSGLLRRVSVIEGFYQSISQPRPAGLQQTA